MNFLKNTVKEINRTKRYIQAGMDIPALKEERRKLNEGYVLVVSRHRAWETHAEHRAEAQALATMVLNRHESLLRFREVEAERVGCSESVATIDSVLVSIRAIQQHMDSISNVYHKYDMDHEQFARETEEYNTKLQAINDALAKARGITR